MPRRRPKSFSSTNGWGAQIVRERCPSSGKVSFDKKSAVTAANKRWADDRVELRIYQCGCGGWHLTSRI